MNKDDELKINSDEKSIKIKKDKTTNNYEEVKWLTGC